MSAPLRHIARVALAAAALWGACAFGLPFKEKGPPLSDTPAAKAIQSADVLENLNVQVPLDATFTDQDGNKVTLGELLEGDKPVLLTLAYYQCPMLCNLVLGGLSKSARHSGMVLGDDFRSVTISIDPRETPKDALDRQRGHLQSLGAPSQTKDWTFLVGEEAEIKKVSEAVGFKYYFDEQSQQYSHAAAIMVLTPEGRVSRYLYGVEFPPRDLRFALLEAAGGRVGTSFDRIILKCFKYDPNTRKYELYVFGFIRGGALLVFGALATALVVFWRREYKRGTIR
jgi:protein SCO1